MALGQAGQQFIHRERVHVHQPVLAPRLNDLAQRKGWSAEDVEDIKAQIGWQGKRFINVIQIRPLEPLPGDAFSGFFDQSDIERSIQIGIQRATDELDRLGIR